jgi:hypothetical protein
VTCYDNIQIFFTSKWFIRKHEQKHETWLPIPAPTKVQIDEPEKNIFMDHFKVNDRVLASSSPMHCVATGPALALLSASCMGNWLWDVSLQPLVGGLWRRHHRRTHPGREGGKDCGIRKYRSYQ